jgi:hypothetical protein
MDRGASNDFPGELSLIRVISAAIIKNTGIYDAIRPTGNIVHTKKTGGISDCQSQVVEKVV